MTRLSPRRYTSAMRYLVAILALIPTLALADIAGPAKMIDGDTIEAIRSLVDAGLNHDTDVLGDRRSFEAITDKKFEP